jgi:hypothetical protein
MVARAVVSEVFKIFFLLNPSATDHEVVLEMSLVREVYLTLLLEAIITECKKLLLFFFAFPVTVFAFLMLNPSL